MKMTLNIVGDTREDLETALEIVMTEVIEGKREGMQYDPKSCYTFQIV